MNGHLPGDTAYIATGGPYTNYSFKDITGILIRPQDTTKRPVFTKQSTLCRIVGCDIGWLNYVSAGNATAIDATCGRIDSTVIHNMYFEGWSGPVISASGNYPYTYGNDTTYKWLRNRFDSLKFYHCGKGIQGAFGIQAPISNDIMRRDTFRRVVVEATTSTVNEGVFFTGVCYDCLFEYNKYTSTTGRGSSGDDGFYYGAGWGTFRYNYSSGAPCYFIRLFPMMELNDTGTTQVYNNAKLFGTEYGFINLQANLGDTIAGQRRANGAKCYNNTMGNQLNDTLGYWSTMFNLGQIGPNCHYYVVNNFGFNIGNNQQRQAANGQPNNGKPFIAGNLGGWNTIAQDTSNNQYSVYATQAALDSATTLFTNSLGNFPAFYLTATSPGRLLGGGVANPLTSVDFLGNPYRVPPDLGYIQFFQIINKTTIPGLHKGATKRFILR